VGKVVLTCNPSYLRDRDREGGGSKPAQGKSQQDSISTNKLGVVAYACHPSYAGGINKRIADQTGLSKNVRPYPKNS
jgi:hypothetical protein